MVSYKIFDPHLVGNEIHEELYGEYVSLREWFILVRENIATLEELRKAKNGYNMLNATPARSGLFDRVNKVAREKLNDKLPLYEALGLTFQPRQHYGCPQSDSDNLFHFDAFDIEKLQVAKEYYATKAEFITERGFIEPNWYDCLAVLNAHYRRNEPIRHIPIYF